MDIFWNRPIIACTGHNNLRIGGILPAQINTVIGISVTTEEVRLELVLTVSLL